MKRILVIGAGTFGQNAVNRLHKADPSAKITVVDQDTLALERLANRSINTVCRDGISFLADQLTDEMPSDWIVPAIPRHVAYDWIRVSLENPFIIESLPVPAAVFSTLPNPIRGPRGEVYMSNVDFVCPADCLEPETLCTCTEKPRPRILHSYLAAMTYEYFRSVVIVSRQLAPGVGGYTPASLFEVLARVKASHSTVLLSTASKCHGVMHAFKIRLKMKPNY